ncbi:MAG TPA: hypothetical protein VNN81_13900, partial [Bradyrhizobium sp.]|nr:hypothetical protein [Bradyrhizobium sp.]
AVRHDQSSAFPQRDMGTAAGDRKSGTSRHSGATPTGPRKARPDDRLRIEPGISRFPDVQLHI